MMKFTQITTFPALVEYLREYLDWPFFEEDPEDNRFDYAPDELGIDPKWSVAIERISQLRPSEGDGPWGIFYLQFEKKRLPVVVLRRILRALVPKARASANSASRPAWNAHDLLFICATGESGQRGITFAHFREVEKYHIAQLRTFGWDESETQIAPLASKLEKLRWENQSDWSRAFTLRHGQLVSDSKALASELAIFARGIRQRTLDLYGVETEDGQLHNLHKAFQSALIADMKPAGFADTVAQTIAYGLFAGRATGATLEKIGLAHLEAFVPKTNPFLRELFAQFTRLGLDVGKGVDFDDLGIVDLVEFLNGIPVKEITDNFGRQSGGGVEDPVVYFYESFLKEYDEKQRVQRGVYYTPKPVVDFIVRGVHQLLIDELDCPDGLADVSRHRVNGRDEFKVMILDPATGTGTFLQSAIEIIHAHLQTKWRGEGIRSEAALKAKWNEYVPQFLLPRLHGFELMMASYTVAHMKLGLKLQELGYEFGSDERLRVFLTNTLEPPHEGDQKVLGFPDFLAHEALAADAVKGQTPITVVIGNPPYSGHSANSGAWIRDLLRSKLPDGADSYFKVDGKDLGERNPKWLNDDYVKFTRYAQFRLSQSTLGVMGFITNHGYLDNPTFRGMRQSLLHTFAQSYQVDLHGNAKKKEKTPDGRNDENVFEIQQGVSLNFGVKGAKTRRIEHAHLWGSQEQKYDFCRHKYLQDANWTAIEANPPFYLFIARDAELTKEYESSWSLPKIMSAYQTGLIAGRDALSIGFEPDELWERVKLFASLPEAQARARFGLGADARDWSVPNAQNDLKTSGLSKTKIRNIMYRPFDVRYIYFTEKSRGFLRWPYANFMGQMFSDNIALCSARSNKSAEMNHFFCSRFIMETKCAESTTQSALFPLYLYPSKTQTAMDLDAQLLGVGRDKRRANLAPEFVAQLGTKLGLKWQSDGRGDQSTLIGPEDVLAYIYAVFHAPSYRARYAEFLKTDFPRVPLTSDTALFRALCAIGHELLAIHTLQKGAGLTPSSNPAVLAARLEEGVSPAPPQGEVAAGFPKYENERVLINKSSGFSGVTEAVWNFHIGGYQVAHKWLKDRKGRVLTDEDAAHYRKVLWALGQTIAHMEAIDELIESAGGFPLAGSSEKIEVDVHRFFG